MTGPRQRILDTARRLFNAQGLHRVGVRDVARAVSMSPGNLAYHFPTREDLVLALVLELHQKVERAVFAALPEALSLLELYRSAQVAMRDMLEYRCLLLGAAGAVRAPPKLQRLRADLRVRRRERHDLLIRALARGGFIDGPRALRRGRWLFEQGELISSGWLTAATLQGRSDDAQIILDYAKVGLALLEPWCTPKGQRQMSRILSGAFDGDEP